MVASVVARVACVLSAILALAGCETATSHRGEVEWGRMQVLTAVDRAPQPAILPRIQYPEVLLAQGIEGSAEVAFVVDSRGVPRDIEVTAASAPEFGEAVTQGLPRMRYVPAESGGRAIPCRIGITLFFRQY